MRSAALARRHARPGAGGTGRAWPLLALALAATPFPGRAQSSPVPPPPRPVTLLHLSATGTAQAAPDQLVAELVAQATSPSAATAQRRVDAMVADGMRAARAVPGIDARALGYAVSPADDRRAGWTARQTIELRAADGPALLDLVGRLQGQGLVTAALDWQPSPALLRRADDEATIAALRALQGRASAAASALGLQVDRLRDVRLDALPLPPRPLGMMAMAARSPAPQATAAPAEITAAVSADVELRP